MADVFIESEFSDFEEFLEEDVAEITAEFCMFVTIV